jgi:hypothetical protein
MQPDRWSVTHTADPCGGRIPGDRIIPVNELLLNLCKKILPPDRLFFIAANVTSPSVTDARQHASDESVVYFMSEHRDGF